MLGELFGASLLIIFGISMLLGAIFGINIPVFRILAGIFLVYLGVQLIANWPARKERSVQHIYFGKRSVSIDSIAIQGEKPIRYAILFGSADIDLSKISETKPEMRPVELEINTIFGSTKIKLTKAIPTKIISSTAFGKTAFPDDTVINFGNYTYHAPDNEKPHLILRTSTAFGKLEIEEK